MAKATLEFDLDNPEDVAAHQRVLNVDRLYLVLHEISNRLFRPARKHGYGNHSHVQQCIDMASDANLEIDDFEVEDHKCDVVTSAISKLEVDFYELLEEYNIDMEDFS